MPKDKYEISLWEDRVKHTADAGQRTNPDYYEEHKIAIIGSDTMSLSCRAMEPKLVENINGTHTFTFKMFYLCKKDSLEEIYRQLFSSNNYELQDSEALKLLVKEITYDNDTYPNPFLDLLVNERKVKVKWKNEWYDFIIKNCQEDSGGKSITYTCTDVYINELSRVGFDIELDTELENNQGTAVELARTVLADTDWVVDEENSDVIQQKEEEPVYEAICQYSTSGARPPQVMNDTTGEEVNLPNDPNNPILVFYKQIQDLVQLPAMSGTTYLQFAYAPAYEREENSQIVTNADCYSFESVEWTKINGESSRETSIAFGPDSEHPYFTVDYKNGVSNNYRASRLVRSQKSVYDPLTDKYCNVYQATEDGTGIYTGLISEDDIIYGYKEVQYKDPTVVMNLVVNAKDYTSTTGWTGDDLLFMLYPVYSSGTPVEDYDGKSYLQLKLNKKFDNDGIRQSSTYTPDGYSIGEEYIFRYKAKIAEDGHPSDDIYIGKLYEETTPGGTTYFRYPSTITPSVAQRSTQNDVIVYGDSYFQITEGPIYPDDDDGFTLNDEIPGGVRGVESSIEPVDPDSEPWVEYRLTCIDPIARADIYSDNIRLVLDTTDARVDSWLEDVQFFPYVMGADTEGNPIRINPGEMDTMSVASVNYVYYNHTKASSERVTSKDDLVKLWNSTTDWDLSYVVPIYVDGFAKIRSITIKQSNCFNILQTIAETFQCWIQFIIEHNEDGTIKYNTADNNPDSKQKEDQMYGTPKKYIRFKNEIGQNTGIGFIYGIDLKTIQRTVKSDQIVTKTIVSPNKNEFAKDGFCSIARSTENYPRTNFLLNFDYYINQGLLDQSKLNRDLYSTTGANIGYYYWLHVWNLQYDRLTERLVAKKRELTNQKSYQTVYEATVTSLQEQIQDLKNELMKLASATTWEDAQDYIEANAELEQVQTRVAAMRNLEFNKAQYEQMLEDISASIAVLEEEVGSIESDQDELTENIKEKNFEFYRRYSRFIQEGTWTSEDYIDDNLYYLDARSVAYTSSRPQITYNISILRLSALEEFKSKVFKLGDISYIQDTEFFGYTDIGGIKTPYREKVLVSEITSFFDEPEKDSFKIQNYKTQFEDLFHRITASVQALKYTAGEYARAASAMNTDGTINGDTLQDSFNENQDIVFTSQNSAIVQDATGLTVTDLTNPNKKTKLTSGGVYVTTDGGMTWRNAVSGEGISTNMLTAGQINTNLINIMDGHNPTFRWDEKGISAYDTVTVTNTNNGTTTSKDSINLSRVVRFDKYGLYGVAGSTNAADRFDEYIPTTESSIWNDAQFGMTWDGFFMKNKYGNGFVEISNTNDIRVMSSPTSERIKIGKLSGEGAVAKYGIRVKNATGESVLVTDDSGNLTITGTVNAHDGVFSGTITGASIYTANIYGTGAFNKNTKGLSVYNAEDGISFYDGSPETTPYTLVTPGREFTHGVTYYELVNSEYIITSDSEPQQGKNYYTGPNRKFFIGENGFGVDSYVYDHSGIKPSYFISTYGDNVYGNFNQLSTGVSDQVLTINGHEIQYSYCANNGNSCQGGEITFGSDTIIIRPASRQIASITATTSSLTFLNEMTYTNPAVGKCNLYVDDAATPLVTYTSDKLGVRNSSPSGIIDIVTDNTSPTHVYLAGSRQESGSKYVDVFWDFDIPMGKISYTYNNTKYTLDFPNMTFTSSNV